ncbi:uncharacterized protein [Euphorbia lathyris]|uniref:uncharacterized protein isoform X1 n=1 Tax=Euphorbia lathyris TaxID=212925 RepID=UPI003313C1B6
MDDYLQYMRTLRSHMNDVEDQATKTSVEEHMLITTIQTMESDVNSAIHERKKLKEEAEQMIQEKGRICTQILEKQRKIASSESDSCTLTQTLELIQQERVSLSSKLIEKSAYYMKVAEDLQSKLQQQKDWTKSHGNSLDMEDNVKDNNGEASTETRGRSTVNHIMMESLRSNSRKNLMADVDSAKKKLNEVTEMNSQLAEENSKVKHLIQEVRCKAKAFMAELLAMNIKSLEEEYEALLSDKAQVLEYLQLLQSQIEELKGISDMIKCACGKEYKIAMDLCA